MSSTSAAPSSLPAAPWKTLFASHLSKLKPPTFVLSTLASSTSSSAPTPFLPRARFVIFRGFWAELPENEHNKAERNERVYESEMPCITTDVRMEKVKELFESSEGRADRGKEQQVNGTGGGGPVEAVWWVEEVGTQWRIKGRAYVLSKDDVDEENSGTRTVKSEVGKRMRVVGEGKEGEWSWRREILGHFGNNSPGIRGSFRNPPPGQPTSAPYDYQNLSVGAKVDTLDDETALSNFRVVVIRPDEVEQTDLSEPDKARRWVYTYREGDGGWDVSERWP